MNDTAARRLGPGNRARCHWLHRSPGLSLPVPPAEGSHSHEVASMLSRSGFTGTLLVIALGCAAPLLSEAAAAKTLEVGKQREFKTPSAAIAAAAPGDTIKIDPGEYFDCAVVNASRLTIEGT